MAAANLNSDNTDLESVFKRFDSNGDGKISASEMSGVVRALRADSTPDEIRLMMAEMDADRDGFVDLKEFVDFFLHDADADASGDDNQLMDAFRMYDLDGNGRISAKELHQVLKRIGEKCSFGDCSKMIRSVDADGDGAVDFKEFKKMMTKKNGRKK